MNIANPIYDVVFKNLMSNARVAKFIIGTILEETVTDIDFNPQETTYKRDSWDTGPFSPLAIFRLDFVATIKTASGEYKKVLVEIQKTRKNMDVYRFRNYLGENYRKLDEVVTDSGKKNVALPIVTIYFLGFTLAVDAIAIKVNRQYKNMITGEIIEKKDDFIERLTHDCYLVQIPRIEGKLQSRLEKLLSLFEQKYFIDDTGIVKEYNYAVDDDDIRSITDMLHFACTDPASRKEIEAEREAIRVYNVGIEQQTEELNEQIELQKKAIEEKEKTIEEKEKTIEELAKEKLDLANENLALIDELRRMKQQLGMAE